MPAPYKGRYYRSLNAAGRVVDGSLGMTMLELMLVLSIMAVILGMAVPGAKNSLQNYHLHSDATSLAGYLSLTRMRAASQYAPYSLDFNPTANTYVVEQMTATAYNPIPTATPSAAAYVSQGVPVYEYGTQYLSSGNTLTNCLPNGVGTYPGPITGNPSGCSGTFQVFFNTRGQPVDGTGSALANGGVAIYLSNANNLTDAVTISAGGAVQTWNWNAGNAQWYAR